MRERERCGAFSGGTTIDVMLVNVSVLVLCSCCYSIIGLVYTTHSFTLQVNSRHHRRIIGQVSIGLHVKDTKRVEQLTCWDTGNDDEEEEVEEVSNREDAEDEPDGEEIIDSVYDGLSLDNLSATFAANVSYFYLKDELGLSDKAMWKVTYEAGSALGMSASTIRSKIECLRDHLDLSDGDINTIIERQPTLLHMDAVKNIAPKIHFLMEELGLSKKELSKLVVAVPSVLCYGWDNLKLKMKFFRVLMGLDNEEIRSLLLTEPNLLRAGVRTGLVPRRRFLMRDMNVPADMLKTITKRLPRILLFSLDDNLIPKLIFYMITTLDMNTEQIHKILLIYPEFLNYNLDRHIIPITNFFLQDFEMSPSEFRSIFLKYPRLMTNSMKKIKQVLGYLRFELGLSGSETKRIVYQAPQVIGLNRTNLEAKVKFLQLTYGLSETELRRVIAGMPTLLTLSVDNNLRLKADFLRQSFNNNSTLLRGAVVKLPTLLGYSLDKRIAPRLQSILSAGVCPSSITVAVPMKELDFEGWLERRALREQKNIQTIDSAPQKKQQDVKRVVHWTRPRQSAPPVDML